MYKVEHYLTAQGEDTFQDYLDAMRDEKAYVNILRRIDRASRGNFGDHRENLRDGVSELRIDVGAGYRVYYTLFENRFVILLLCVGNKKTQTQDIEKACRYRADYLVKE